LQRQVDNCLGNAGRKPVGHNTSVRERWSIRKGVVQSREIVYTLLCGDAYGETRDIKNVQVRERAIALGYNIVGLLGKPGIQSHSAPLGGVFQKEFKRADDTTVDDSDVDGDTKWRLECPGKPETCLCDGVQTVIVEMDMRPDAWSKASPTPFGTDVRDYKRGIGPSASGTMLEDEGEDVVGSPACHGDPSSMFGNYIQVVWPRGAKLLDLSEKALGFDVYRFNFDLVIVNSRMDRKNLVRRGHFHAVGGYPVGNTTVVPSDVSLGDLTFRGCAPRGCGEVIKM